MTTVLVIPLWLGLVIWMTVLAILAVLLFFAIRIRPHDIRKLEGESLKTLREIRDSLSRLREELVMLIRTEVARHEEEYHDVRKRLPIPGEEG